MTSTIGPLLENCCGCKDDGCNNKCSINIESTNPDCLRVDTSECWVVKLEPVCPPEVIAWENVTVDVIDCEEGEDCNFKYKVNANSPDEKVKVCRTDTTPWYLSDKVEWDNWIVVEPVGCDSETNAKLRVSINPNWKPKIEIPEIQVNPLSNLVTLTVSWEDWHTLTIADKEESTYDNMCCIWFESNQDFTDGLDSWGNAEHISYMWENWHDWSIFTGNPKMATKKWIKILADWYYRLFCQITVWNNTDNNFYLNLWRWFLKIKWDRFNENKQTLLSTAKHWAYARQILLDAWNWIDVSNQWKIEEWDWNWQTSDWLNWPWMTFNIDTLVDLKAGDTITVWYRPQSNNKSSSSCSFRFVWQRDGSYDTSLYDVLFWWTLLGVYQLAPKRFQKNSSNQIYEQIWNNE